MSDQSPLVIASGQIRQSAAGDVILCPSIKDSALTATRILFAGADGLLSNSASLIYNGTNLITYQNDDNSVTQLLLKNMIASGVGNTSAYTLISLFSSTSSGYFAAFPDDFATAFLRDYMVFGANSSAAGFILHAPVAGQNIKINSPNVFVGGTTTPTALLHLSAGGTAASSAPIKLTSGSLNTTAEAGAVEFLTDKLYLTITTGAVRKELALSDGLTSGYIPYVTTNGRLTNDSRFNVSFDGPAGGSVTQVGLGKTYSNHGNTGIGLDMIGGIAMSLKAGDTGCYLFQVFASDTTTLLCYALGGSGGNLILNSANNNINVFSPNGYIQLLAGGTGHCQVTLGYSGDNYIDTDGSLYFRNAPASYATRWAILANGNFVASTDGTGAYDLTTGGVVTAAHVAKSTHKADGVHLSSSITYISGTGTAGTDNTAQTVKTVTLPINTLTQVGDRIRIRTYWTGDTGSAITGSVKLNTVLVTDTTDGGAATLQLNEAWLHYIDSTHANIIESEAGALGGNSGVNIAGFNWAAAQDIIFTQNQIANNHCILYALIVDVFPKGY